MRRQGLREILEGVDANGGEYEAPIRSMRETERRPGPGVLARRAGLGAVAVHGPAASRRGATAGLPATVLVRRVFEAIREIVRDGAFS